MTNQPLIDGIIKLCRELVAPTVELEIKEAGSGFGQECEEGMVACPCIVGGALEIADLREETRGYTLAQESLDAVGLRGYDEKEFVVGKYLEGDADEAIVHLGEEGRPIGACMGPSELYAALRMPLGGEEGGANLGLLRACLMGKLEVEGEVANRGGGRGEMDCHERERGCRKTATYKTGRLTENRGDGKKSRREQRRREEPKRAETARAEESGDGESRRER